MKTQFIHSFHNIRLKNEQSKSHATAVYDDFRNQTRHNLL